MDNGLTSVEFAGIRKNLENISDTWADLWVMLSLTQPRVTQLLLSGCPGGGSGPARSRPVC